MTNPVILHPVVGIGTSSGLVGRLARAVGENRMPDDIDAIVQCMTSATGMANLACCVRRLRAELD